MPDHQFRFYLQPDPNNYYYWDGKAVQVTSEPRNLKHAPKGWESTEIKWGRNLDYRTLMRSFSNSYEFVKDGLSILRYISNTQGIEGVCRLLIKKKLSTDLLFYDWYSGDIDFSSFQDLLTTGPVEIAESGLAAKLKAYANTPQEIKLTVSNGAVRCLADGIKLRGTQNYVPISYSPPVSALPDNKYIGFPIYPTNKEGDYPVSIAQAEQFSGNMGFPDYIDTGFRNNYIYEAVGAQRISISYKDTVNFYKNSSAAADAKFKVLALVCNKNASTTVNNVSQTILIYQDPINVTNGAGQTINIEATTAQFNLAAGDQVFIVVLITAIANGSNLYGFNWNGVPGVSYLKVRADFQLDASEYRGLRVGKLFGFLADGMSGITGSAQSDLLNSPNLVLNDDRPYHDVVTCGDSLRGFVEGYDSITNKETTPKIKTTFNDFLKYIYSTYPAGLGLENEKLVIELIGRFFDKDTMVFDLGEVDALEIAPAEEYYASNLRIGYEPQTYDGLNGKDEYNTSQAYKMPITRATETADFVSPYRSDPYGEEIYRANLSNKKTTDSNSDNDVFVNSINSNTDSSGRYGLYRPQNLPGNSLSGVLFPDTMFNVDRTPKHNLYRMGTWLRMMTYRQEGKKLTFQTTDKNPDVRSNLGTGTVVDNADVPVSDLAALPFQPVYLRCKTRINGLTAIMATYPKGYFKGTRYGNPFMGFFDSGSVRPAQEDIVSLQLLAHPDLDILTLAERCAR